jgi:hypothetical protein
VTGHQQSFQAARERDTRIVESTPGGHRHVDSNPFMSGVAVQVNWSDIEASDSTTALAVQKLLGHSAATTTDRHIRHRVGERVTPIMRKIADEPK